MVERKIHIREWNNFCSGLLSFITWSILSYKTPEHCLKLAISSLIILLGFGGRDSIISIIQMYYESKINHQR